MTKIKYLYKCKINRNAVYRVKKYTKHGQVVVCDINNTHVGNYLLNHCKLIEDPLFKDALVKVIGKKPNRLLKKRQKNKHLSIINLTNDSDNDIVIINKDKGIRKRKRARSLISNSKQELDNEDNENNQDNKDNNKENEEKQIELLIPPKKKKMKKNPIDETLFEIDFEALTKKYGDKNILNRTYEKDNLSYVEPCVMIDECFACCKDSIPNLPSCGQAILEHSLSIKNINLIDDIDNNNNDNNNNNNNNNTNKTKCSSKNKLNKKNNIETSK